MSKEDKRELKVRRWKAKLHGRFTNRINCPWRYDQDKCKLISFDKCLTCPYKADIGEHWVDCTYSTRSMLKKGEI